MNRFVPRHFEPPSGISTALFSLSQLAPRHAEADYDAVMSSRPRLQRYQGSDRRELYANLTSAKELGGAWPTASMTLEYNRADLAAHSEEFDRRMAFAYTVFSAEHPAVCVGCVYVNPSRKTEYDAQVTLWLRDSHIHLDGELYATVKAWVLRDGAAGWQGAGWREVAWPGRVQSFDEWDSLQSQPDAAYRAMRLARFGGSVTSLERLDAQPAARL